MNQAQMSLLDTFTVGRFASSVIIVAVAMIVARLFQEVNTRLSRKNFPQFRLRIEQGITVVKFIVLVSGVALAILALFGFSKEMILAVGGSAAVAIGFGLKDIAASVLAGFVILFERPCQVGDRVKFAEVYGDVVSIGLRSIRIRTLDDSIVTVPNSRLITDPILSANAGQLDMMAQMDVFISPASNLDVVEKIAREAAVASRFVYLRKPVRVLFSDVFIEETFCTRVRIQAYVIDTRYEKLFESDVTRRLHVAFGQHGIVQPQAKAIPRLSTKTETPTVAHA